MWIPCQWALNKLKRYGFNTEELVFVYKSYIRPLAEYVSVVRHPMLSAEQPTLVEKQKTQALRIFLDMALAQGR